MIIIIHINIIVIKKSLCSLFMSFSINPILKSIASNSPLTIFWCSDPSRATSSRSTTFAASGHSHVQCVSNIWLTNWFISVKTADWKDYRPPHPVHNIGSHIFHCIFAHKNELIYEWFLFLINPSTGCSGKIVFFQESSLFCHPSFARTTGLQLVVQKLLGE